MHSEKEEGGVQDVVDSDEEEHDSNDDFDADDDDDEEEIDEPEALNRATKRMHNEDSGDTGEPASKHMKPSKGNLYKPPTNEEMHQLKQTENLFHSTLFRMQIGELLSEVQLKAGRFKRIEEAVSVVKAILTHMKAGKLYELSSRQLAEHLGDIKVPVQVAGDPADKGRFQFHPPINVQLAGSCKHETCLRPHVHADVLVEIPKECFDGMDHLNMRYFRKRALYLSFVTKTLSQHKDITEAKFAFLHSNHLKPVVRVKVKAGEGGKPVHLQLHAVPQSGAFRTHRFHMNKNNVRSAWFNSQGHKQEADVTESPTPFYNSSALEDVVAMTTESHLQEKLASFQGVKEGIVLLKVWLRQRHLDTGYGGFSGFIMTMYVTYLLAQKQLNRFMSSYQVFRNTLLKLGKSDWTSNGISLCKVTTDQNMPLISDFHKHFDVVFVDITGYLNLCYAMDRTVFQRVQHEAKLALQMLEEKGGENFDKLFIRNLPFSLVFDHIVHVQLTGATLGRVLDRLSAEDSYQDHVGSRLLACRSGLVSLLHKALRPRVKLLQVSPQSLPQWDVTEKPVTLDSMGGLTVGLLLEPTAAFNILDRGPSADTSEAEEFRSFWGSELRRFQDGGICEAIVWQDKGLYCDKQRVCERVIKHVLQRHVGMPASCVSYVEGQLDSVLHLPVKQTGNTPTYGTGEEQTMAVLQSYEGLCKMLRRMDDLPLSINAIQGVHPCFRYAEVFPPMPCTFRHTSDVDRNHGVSRYVPTEDKPCALYTHPLTVVCTLEGSGKWPDDLEAMRRLKTAFCIQIAETLASQYKLKTRVTASHIDVLKDNYVFRLVLAYSREIALLRSVTTPDGKVLKRETENSILLARDTIALPRLSSTLSGLQQSYPSFSSTVRLAKRWICCHMLGELIHPVAVELIAASLYLAPAPLLAPSSGMVGFERFLDLLSTFDWKTTPLLVNLNNEFTDSDLAEIPSRFTKERSTLPFMFIATPLDKVSRHWTHDGPSPMIVQRMVMLAAASLRLIQDARMQAQQPDLKQMFRPTLSVFDVLIHLLPRQLGRKYENVDFHGETSKLTYGQEDVEHFPVVDFDPVQIYLKQLQETFGDLGLFLYDRHGGSVIGVLWKPHVHQTRPFKVSHVNHSKLEMSPDGQPLTSVNIEAVVEDFTVFGKGLVHSVDINTSKTAT